MRENIILAVARNVSLVVVWMFLLDTAYYFSS